MLILNRFVLIGFALTVPVLNAIVFTVLVLIVLVLLPVLNVLVFTVPMLTVLTLTVLVKRMSHMLGSSIQTLVNGRIIVCLVSTENLK